MKYIFKLLLLILVNPIFALNLELTQGINAALPIAVNNFAGGQEANAVKEIIQNDFSLCGQFKLINTSYYGVQPSLEQWKRAGADSVLSGRVQATTINNYSVEFQLYDSAANGRLILAKKYQISKNELRDLAHHISDEVYEKLTGERGIFSTKIAYVVVQRSGDASKYTLDVADIDGNNPRSLLTSTEPIMSPTWSPDGRQIAYVSFEKKRAQIFTVSVETGSRKLLTNFEGINGAPSWSPDGKQLAVVLSKSGTPKIYSIDMSSGRMTQLTFGDSIDTEPRFSPDGKSILFTSGRGGTPQIYRLSLGDGKITRLTYEGNYNARASYTPNQKSFVMLHREDRDFNIAVQDTNSGRVTALTNSPFDESPTISPNGKLILYETHFQDKGILSIVSLDGRITYRLPSRSGDIQDPAWSPYLG